MNVSDFQNPFDYANPIRDSSLFAGRQTELSRIFYILNQVSTSHPVAYLAVTGERAAGKTSILNITEGLVKREGRITVRIDLVPGDDDPVVFFTKMYEELISALSSIKQITDATGEPITARAVRKIIHGDVASNGFPLEFPESLHHATQGGSLSELALRTDLTYLMQLVNQPIAFLIDEAQELATTARILSILRTTGMRLNGYLFILAGTSDLANQINDVFSPILRQFEIIPVARFTELQEMRSCISRPLKSIGLALSDCFEDPESAIQDLMMLTGGSPYEVQLFCHVLFMRWQAGLAENLALTPDAVDDVRKLLESSQDFNERPIISAVRRLSSESLAALYLLCCCRGKSTFDEIWFAYNLALEIKFTRESLHNSLDRLVADGLIEVLPNECIDLNGDMFDLIYTKVWVRTRSDLLPPNVTLGLPDFRHLLTQRLDRLMAELLPASIRMLETCCYGTRPTAMRKAYESLVTTNRPTNFPSHGEFIYCAAADAGLPQYLRIITVTCEYGTTKAIRWALNQTADTYKLEEDPRFLTVTQRLAPLGGTLYVERSDIGPCDWPDLLTWAQSASAEDRNHIAFHLSSRGYDAYAKGNRPGAIDYFGAAFRLAPTWRAANNQAYILLTNASFDAAVDWAAKAVPLAPDSGHRALTRYNRAIALLGSNQPDAAREELEDAKRDLAESDYSDISFSYLLVATLAGGQVKLNETRTAKLADACNTLGDLIGIMSRFPSISFDNNPVS